MRSDRRGFTIVELIVVAMLGTLLLLSIYQVLVTNQRTYRENTDNVRDQQAARMAMDVLVAELQEVSSEGGDFVAVASDSVAFTAMSRFGIICAIDTSAAQVLMDVKKYEAFFESGDSVVMYADNNTDRSDDDVWVKAEANQVDTTGHTCSDGTTAFEIRYTAGQKNLFRDDTVGTGAPIRTLEKRSYGLGTYSGSTFLMRTVGGTTTPIAGPLESAGVSFVYYDDEGNTTTTPADVEKIVLTVNSGTTLTATVYPRN